MGWDMMILLLCDYCPDRRMDEAILHSAARSVSPRRRTCTVCTRLCSTQRWSANWQQEDDNASAKQHQCKQPCGRCGRHRRCSDDDEDDVEHCYYCWLWLTGRTVVVAAAVTVETVSWQQQQQRITTAPTVMVAAWCAATGERLALYDWRAVCRCRVWTICWRWRRQAALLVRSRFVSSWVFCVCKWCHKHHESWQHTIAFVRLCVCVYVRLVLLKSICIYIIADVQCGVKYVSMYIDLDNTSLVTYTVSWVINNWCCVFVRLV